MNKGIEFKAKNEYYWKVAPKPYPSSTVIPNWWKEMYPYEKSYVNPEGKKIIVENLLSNATFKKCTPMLDALTAGYIIPLWTDVQVRQVDNRPTITWRVRGMDVFKEHAESASNIESPLGYYSQPFKFFNGWIPVVPKGYSILVTSPLGHRNLPFQAIPAVIDSDKSMLEVVPPVWLRNDFEGIVEKGTPIVQIIPFKRDNWKSKFSFYKNGEYEVIEDKNFGSNIVNNYVRNHWTKKSFK